MQILISFYIFIQQIKLFFPLGKIIVKHLRALMRANCSLIFMKSKCIMLQKISISNKCCSFALSIHLWILKMKCISFHKNIGTRAVCSSDFSAEKGQLSAAWGAWQRTQCRVPYSENMGYVSNPRHSLSLDAAYLWCISSGINDLCLTRFSGSLLVDSRSCLRLIAWH